MSLKMAKGVNHFRDKTVEPPKKGKIETIF